MNIVGTTSQDAEEAVTYALGWSQDLNGATISSSTWSASPSGVTLVPIAALPDLTSVRVSGGTPGTTYTVSNLVVLSSNDKLKAGITVAITS